MSTPEKRPDAPSLASRLEALDGIAKLRRSLSGSRVYLVGGAVRDLLRGATRADLDLVVEGDAVAVASGLGLPVRAHDRFGTASVDLDGLRVDLASARRERYERPGALPVVEPAPLADDLARRDFTVNAMGLPLFGAVELIDPHGGLGDLEARRLRVLHPLSFVDDPTRALRAARYAARLGFELEPATAELVSATSLESVSAERIEAELRRTVLDGAASAALRLLASWGLAGVDAGAAGRLEAVREVVSDPAWADVADREEALMAAAVPDARLETAALRLASARPSSPSEGVALTRGRPPVELVAARAAGGAWLDEWVRKWRNVGLEIDGEDLMARGVPEGPAVGRGLAGALAAKLDGKTAGRDDELRVALAAAS